MLAATISFRPLLGAYFFITLYFDDDLTWHQTVSVPYSGLIFSFSVRCIIISDCKSFRPLFGAYFFIGANLSNANLRYAVSVPCLGLIFLFLC